MVALTPTRRGERHHPTSPMLIYCYIHYVSLGIGLPPPCAARPPCSYVHYVSLGGGLQRGRLGRTDYFPGLGWMITASTWRELREKWPTHATTG